jgi:hypothetical protein
MYLLFSFFCLPEMVRQGGPFSLLSVLLPKAFYQHCIMEIRMRACFFFFNLATLDGYSFIAP